MFFPDRIPRTVKYDIDEQYKNLFSEEVVDMINDLYLSRYDLNRYKKNELNGLSDEDKRIFKDLERSRAHPKGFCRIGLFKRLESSGPAFLKSIQRHILRNYIFIYAIENGEDLMIKEGSSDILTDAFDDREGGITGFSDVAESGEEEEENYFSVENKDYYQKAKERYVEYKKIKNISSG